jgi:hypothetical protein
MFCRGLLDALLASIFSLRECIVRMQVGGPPLTSVSHRAFPIEIKP